MDYCHDRKSQLSLKTMNQNYKKSTYYKKLIQKSSKVWNLPYNHAKKLTLPSLSSCSSPNPYRTIKIAKKTQNKAGKNVDSDVNKVNKDDEGKLNEALCDDFIEDS